MTPPLSILSSDPTIQSSIPQSVLGQITKDALAWWYRTGAAGEFTTAHAVVRDAEVVLVPLYECRTQPVQQALMPYTPLRSTPRETKWVNVGVIRFARGEFSFRPSV